MGDAFTSHSSKQTATNQQIGFSTRDVGGSVITVGAGADVSSGAIHVESLDATALQAAAGTINHALDANTENSQKALQAYQNALSVVAENQQATQQIGTGQTAQGSSILGQVGVNPSQIIWIAVLVTAGVIVMGFINKRK